MTKIFKIKEEKINIFCGRLDEFQWIFRKMKLIMILKVTKNKALHSLKTMKCVLGVKVSFFKWNFNISFCLISNLSSYLNKNKLLAHVHDNVQHFHDHCRTLGLEMTEKNITTWYYFGCKKPHKPERTFSGFSWSYTGPKSNLHLQHQWGCYPLNCIQILETFENF